jgi:hypothetical protein
MTSSPEMLFLGLYVGTEIGTPGFLRGCAAANVGTGPGAGAEFKPVRGPRSQKLPMPTD